jgi:hypothetical protein
VPASLDASGVAAEVGDPARAQGAAAAEPEAPAATEEASAAPEESAAEPEAPGRATTSALKPLKFPPIREMVSCMRVLLGDEVDIKKTPLTVDYQQELEQFWISVLIDDDGKEVGAVLANLAATVHLGGVLMMLPESELKAQMRSGEPSEDAIAAMSEVCNNLSGSFNNVQGNMHVRSGYLEPHDLKTRLWIKSVKNVQQLQDNFGGQMLLLTRHA